MGKYFVSTRKVMKYLEDIKSGNKEAFYDLSKLFIPMIKSIASKIILYAPPTVQWDDLINYGLFGLWQAVEKFDLKNIWNTKFSSFAYWRIKGAMLDGIRKESIVSRGYWNKYKELENIINEFEAKNGREPTIDELEEITGMAKEEIDATLSAINFVMGLSIEADNREEILRFKVEDDPSKQVEREDLKRIVMEQLQLLSEKEKYVIYLIYFEQLSSTAVAKILNISVPRVSQLHASALRKLKKYLGKNLQFLVGEVL